VGIDAKGRYAAIVKELDIPAPFDLGEFITGLERQRRRPIRLRPFRSARRIPCGMWIGTATEDYLYYTEGITPYHQDHIALHEAAHMILDHRRSTQAGKPLADLLAPDIDPQFLQLVVGRSVYNPEEEREAETLASLIHTRPGDQPRPLPASGANADRFLSLLQVAFGGTGAMRG
jgi:hypothetical protein